MEQKRQLPVLKETWVGLKDVHSQVLQDVIKRLHNTWEKFRKSTRYSSSVGSTSGYPVI
jgi:putative transposase